MPLPVLVAMNNPISSDPKYALYPAPQGCTGHRLWEMLDLYARAHWNTFVSKVQYRDAFDRRNVLSQKEWSMAEARVAGAELAWSLLNRRVVVLGVQTLEALLGKEPRPPWGQWREATVSRPHEVFYTSPGLLRYCLLPHPSGRCREYNDPRMRELTGRTLWELYRNAVSP